MASFRQMMTSMICMMRYTPSLSTWHRINHYAECLNIKPYSYVMSESLELCKDVETRLLKLESLDNDDIFLIGKIKTTEMIHNDMRRRKMQMKDRINLKRNRCITRWDNERESIKCEDDKELIDEYARNENEENEENEDVDDIQKCYTADMEQFESDDSASSVGEEEEFACWKEKPDIGDDAEQDRALLKKIQSSSA